MSHNFGLLGQVKLTDAPNRFLHFDFAASIYWLICSAVHWKLWRFDKTNKYYE
jgi:hypothetical protein